MKVRDIMTKEVVSVDPKATVADTAKKMRDANVGSVVVIDRSNNEVKGIVTDRKIVTSVIAESRDPMKEPIGNIVSKSLLTCKDDSDVHDVVKAMGQNKVRRMPVVNERKELVGVLSMSDVARDMRGCMDSLFDEMSKSSRHAERGPSAEGPHVR